MAWAISRRCFWAASNCCCAEVNWPTYCASAGPARLMRPLVSGVGYVMKFLMLLRSIRPRAAVKARQVEGSNSLLAGVAPSWAIVGKVMAAAPLGKIPFVLVCNVYFVAVFYG